jgi:hypothetical protein
MAFDDLPTEAARDSKASTVEAAVAAEAAAREELRQGRVRAEMEAQREAENQARAGRERAQATVLGSFMTYGTRQQAQALIETLGLASDAELRRLDWMSSREIYGRPSSQRTWYFNAFVSTVGPAMEAAARREYITTEAGEKWKFCLPMRRGPEDRTRTVPEHWPPLPKHAAADTSGLKPGTTFAGRQENERREGLRRQAEWLKAATQQKSEAEEVKAVLMAFQQEMREEIRKALSAKAAAPPVTETGQGDGVASTQALQVQVQALEKKVVDLTECQEGRAEAVLRRPAGGNLGAQTSSSRPPTRSLQSASESSGTRSARRRRARSRSSCRDSEPGWAPVGP